MNSEKPRCPLVLMLQVKQCCVFLIYSSVLQKGFLKFLFLAVVFPWYSCRLSSLTYRFQDKFMFFVAVAVFFLFPEFRFITPVFLFCPAWFSRPCRSKDTSIKIFLFFVRGKVRRWCSGPFRNSRNFQKDTEIHNIFQLIMSSGKLQSGRYDGRTFTCHWMQPLRSDFLSLPKLLPGTMLLL